MTFLRHYFIVCTPLFLLSNRTVFPIDFISILLNYFCQKSLRFFLRIPIMQHKILQIRIRARNFSKQLFALSTGKSIETKGPNTIFKAF